MRRVERLAAREGRAMGSRLRLVAPASIVDRAWAVVEERFDLLERTLSRFAPDSPLSALNRAAGSGRWVAAPAELRRALRAADRAQRLTDGRFDPRVIGILEALGDRAGIALPASPDRLEPRGRWLQIDAGGRVRLAAPVDLGGIGKGIAADAASAALWRLGMAPHLVEAGGDLRVRGLPPDGGPWRIAVEHPDRDVPMAIIEVRGGGVATSSLRMRRWIGPDGREIHHLVDPASGRPARGLRSVTVAAPTATLAETWSTATFVAGRADADATGGHAAWWVADDGTIGQVGGRVRR